MSETAAGVARVQDVVAEVMVTHAARGARLQAGLRVGVIVFVWACLLLVPPTDQAGWCYAIAVAYPVLWALTMPWTVRRRPGGRDLGWVPLVLDIVVLGAVTLLAGFSADDSWTAYVVVNGFFLLPILAATQLSPRVGVVMAVPTVGVYLLSSVSTREANDEPWESLALRVLVLLGVSLGSIALSRIQRSRVMEIATLAIARAGLLAELTDVEERERRQLSEALHDGALQYVLAARMDLEDVRDGDPDAVERVDHALTTSAGLLRRTVSALHPAVLDHAGLVRAVFAALRELVTNVVKHSGATSVVVELEARDDRIVASVTDDGTGFDETRADERLAAGHIGLASQRLRVEAVGGGLVATPVEPHGLRMTVSVPG